MACPAKGLSTKPVNKASKLFKKEKRIEKSFDFKGFLTLLMKNKKFSPLLTLFVDRLAVVLALGIHLNGSSSCSGTATNPSMPESVLSGSSAVRSQPRWVP